MKKRKRSLNYQQERFCNEYLINKLNATKAYMIAYPKVKNKSTASVNGCRLLRNEEVRKRIAELIRAAIARINAT